MPGPTRIFLAVALALALLTAAVEAGLQGVEITPLLRTTPDGEPQREAVVVRAVFQPGSGTGRHVHPGDEYATVIEGALELRVAGQPARSVVAGQAYHNPRGVIHETVNAGRVPARVISTFIIDHGQPLVQPAP